MVYSWFVVGCVCFLSCFWILGLEFVFCCSGLTLIWWFAFGLLAFNLVILRSVWVVGCMLVFGVWISLVGLVTWFDWLFYLFGFDWFVISLVVYGDWFV